MKSSSVLLLSLSLWLTLIGIIDCGINPVVLPHLPYTYHELEPHIDQATMKVHHSGHHQAYVNNLNGAIETLLKSTNDDIQKFIWQAQRIETLLANLHLLPVDEATKKIIRNNGGGFVNHNLFFELMMDEKHRTSKPSERVTRALSKYFGSVDEFIKQFNDQALKVFGSGWVVLVKRTNLKTLKSELLIKTYANQDSAYMNEQLLTNSQKGSSSNTVESIDEPVLLLDVWEHAYYLKHQNKRAAYVSDWWNVVHWSKVEDRLFKCEFDVEFIDDVELKHRSSCNNKDEL
ncbi:hypothetical protein C9374_007268 [Naegleria lovaniensis]|uniref:superoxide dismutase n=1 Tax=Naegleria lovaniensis TaxID=51637 RepID=A0AA88H776_NAELO|nr:uncharacterized protein C9374_007268 [Naegleria lovaniensis]KAG2393737.1 hypothetical protein C9374_007268 [Naegleria lovaniensis]